MKTMVTFILYFFSSLSYIVASSYKWKCEEFNESDLVPLQDCPSVNFFELKKTTPRKIFDQLHKRLFYEPCITSSELCGEYDEFFTLGFKFDNNVVKFLQSRIKIAFPCRLRSFYEDIKDVFSAIAMTDFDERLLKVLFYIAIFDQDIVNVPLSCRLLWSLCIKALDKGKLSSSRVAIFCWRLHYDTGKLDNETFLLRMAKILCLKAMSTQKYAVIDRYNLKRNFVDTRDMHLKKTFKKIVDINMDSQDLCEDFRELRSYRYFLRIASKTSNFIKNEKLATFMYKAIETLKRFGMYANRTEIDNYLLALQSVLKGEPSEGDLITICEFVYMKIRAQLFSSYFNDSKIDYDSPVLNPPDVMILFRDLPINEARIKINS